MPPVFEAWKDPGFLGTKELSALLCIFEDKKSRYTKLEAPINISSFLNEKEKKKVRKNNKSSLVDIFAYYKRP